MSLCIEETQYQSRIVPQASELSPDTHTAYAAYAPDETTVSPPLPAAQDAAAASAAAEAPPDAETGGDFVDFSQLAQAWIQQLPCIGDSLAAPALADAWADTILDAWFAARASGALDPAQPLMILDLAPGQGRLAVQVLRRLQQRLTLLGCADWCVRYCALAASREARDMLRGHPALQAFFTLGWFSVISHWPAGQRQNPVVVVSLGNLGTHISQLYAVHYGRIFSGSVAARSSGQDGVELDYRWQEAVVPASLHEWLEHYAGRLNTAPLLIAPETLQQMDAIAALAGGRYLLLAVDLGAVSEQQLREHAMCPPTLWRAGANRLPVNFELIGLYQRRHGAQTRNLILADGGWVVHAALSNWPLEIDALMSRLTGAHPDHLALQRSGANLNLTDPASVLAALRAANYDPCLLQAALHSLIETPPVLDASQARDWRLALEQVWYRAGALMPSGDFLFEFANFALHLGQANIAREALGLLLLDAPDDFLVRHLYACCEATTGRSEMALSLLQDCDDPALNPLRQQLQSRIDAWPADFDTSCALDGELILEPLDGFHAQAFLVQYRDREIGIATRLPELDSVEAVCAWLAPDSAGEATKQSAQHYALMHQDSGLVGAAGLNRIGTAAYFYFWIGTDYQGRGFGQRAGRLAFAQARAAGIEEIFTSVYEDNRRSQQALEALGAVRLMPPAEWDGAQSDAVAPDEAMVFYRYALRDGMAEGDAFERMQTLRRELRDR